MSKTSIEVNYAAYSTLILHCAKYPAAEVMGFLLGRISSSKVVVERAIPVQHQWNRLSPMVEVAASLTHAYASSQSSPLQVVGLYTAPSDVASSTQSDYLASGPAKVAHLLASKLGEEAIALKVNNSLLSSTTAHALNGFVVASGSVKSLPSQAVQLQDKNSISLVSKAKLNGAWQEIVDFDDHLQDTSLNWLENGVTA